MIKITQNTVDYSQRLQSSPTNYLIHYYLPFVTRLLSFSTVLWRFSDEFILVFTFYLIIAYFIRFSSFSSSHVTPIRRADYIFLSDSIFIDYSITPHHDTLYQINYCHPPSPVPIFVHFPPPPHIYQTLFQFIGSLI